MPSDARAVVRRILEEEVCGMGPVRVMLDRMERRLLQAFDTWTPQGRVILEQVNLNGEKTCDQRVGAPARSVAVFESRPFAMAHHSELVEQIKDRAAALHAVLDKITPGLNPEVGRLLELSKSNLETAVMQAVKALSRFSPSKMEK